MRWSRSVVMVACLIGGGRTFLNQPVGRRRMPRVMFATQQGRASAAVKQQQEMGKVAQSEKLEVVPPRGTRDFYPEEMRVRTWLFGEWRAAAARHGFEEYDSPILESEALYTRKAGEEVTQQLYNFEDKGGRRVSLRPEMTPSLARMVMARRNGLPMPLKWFSIPQCWRFEKPSRGRRREHYQWNMDIWGVEGVTAEAELLAAVVGFFEAVGLTSEDVGIKVNSREVLAEVLRSVAGVDADEEPARFAATCVLVDKLDKLPPSALYDDFAQASGMSSDDVDALVDALDSSTFDDLPVGSRARRDLTELFDLADAYKIADWLVFDAKIVRGLAYYTGIVFEGFDRSGKLRAICGGGRYDQLLATFGGEALPAVGFGFGDAVVMELLEMKGLVPQTVDAVDVLAFPFAADDPDLSADLGRAAATVAATLRRHNLNVDLVLQGKKPKAAFKQADRRRAALVVMVAPEEWQNGDLVVKDMALGTQATVPLDDLADYVIRARADPPKG
ncbi:hypothetical protein CTAYLR_006656 [Chrysophaeum taylorii]|uniref:histidine--tRNA ligase n=1 Tax=Chrysophaeum taylorii TaxID=2483200 RepID=A0AAD7UDD1_9STRA|nr:hypothetical protein CTAYLR_006656 [Chrysophaeum taylorii]